MVEKRSIALCIVLSIVTCGIYAIYWFICMVNEVNLVSDDKEAMSGGVVFLLSIVTCSIYLWVWMYQAGDRLNKAKAMRGMPTDSSLGIIYLLLSIFGLQIISYALIQNELNKVAQLLKWQKEGEEHYVRY